MATEEYVVMNLFDNEVEEHCSTRKVAEKYALDWAERRDDYECDPDDDIVIAKVIARVKKSTKFTIKDELD